MKTLFSFKECLSENGRTAILNHCLASKHENFRLTSCEQCFNNYFNVGGRLKALCDSENHKKLKYTKIVNSNSGETRTIDYFLCKQCHENAVLQSLCKCTQKCETICELKNVCDHGCVRTISSLQPITIGLVGVSNYEYDPEYKIKTEDYKLNRKIIIEETFSGSNCIESFFNYLRDNVLKFQSLQNPHVPAFRCA